MTRFSGISVFVFTLWMYLVVSPHEAYAYLGPGVGIGLLGALFGSLGVAALAVLGMVWYPIRQFRRKQKSQSCNSEQGESLQTEQNDQQHAVSKL